MISKAFLIGTVLTGTMAGAVIAAPKSVEAIIKDNMFAPGILTITKGTTVTWLNKEDYPHSVQNEQGTVLSPELETDDKFSWTFDQTGKYSLFCGIHPTMKTTVIVTP